MHLDNRRRNHQERKEKKDGKATLPFRIQFWGSISVDRSRISIDETWNKKFQNPPKNIQKTIREARSAFPMRADETKPARRTNARKHWSRGKKRDRKTAVRQLHKKNEISRSHPVYRRYEEEREDATRMIDIDVHVTSCFGAWSWRSIQRRIGTHFRIYLQISWLFSFREDAHDDDAQSTQLTVSGDD